MSMHSPETVQYFQSCSLWALPGLCNQSTKSEQSVYFERKSPSKFDISSPPLLREAVFVPLIFLQKSILAYLSFLAPHPTVKSV